MLEKLLIIDKETQVLSFLARHFASSFTVFTATTSDVGLKIAKKERPTLIIIEANSSGLDIKNFIEQIQKMPTPPGVLILAANTDLARARNAVAIGAAEYILKPFKVDDIQKAIERILSAKKSGPIARASVENHPRADNGIVEKVKKPNAIIIGTLSGAGLSLLPALKALVDAFQMHGSGRQYVYDVIATGGLSGVYLLFPLMLIVFVVSTPLFIIKISRDGRLSSLHYLFSSIAVLYFAFYMFAVIVGS